MNTCLFMFSLYTSRLSRGDNIFGDLGLGDMQSVGVGMGVV